MVGWACRLPGAGSINDLWSLLIEGHSAISSVPPDRFSLSRYSHPRRQERGKSYTWAAGLLDDIWGFDPSVFGLSPREAVQMDPQQRLLLQMTWEALEDAGIRPWSLAGTGVGVFVGGSQSDYGQAFFSDPAIADAQFATGTALSILSNRISYVFDLRGPSMTIDTACSSALVALHQAVEAIRAGRIDTAIVAGINLIASPSAFIAFSQASMLSPTGRCSAFSEEADGFVRGEGGAVLVLRKASHAQVNRNPIHGLVLATDVNSDGHTNGISLPSFEAQQALLDRIYSRANIDPDRLAFVEAHGTGTPAGDPIEAHALGRSLGARRANPLPIGSIKTNIGHLEPAAGLAGLLKAMLALNSGILPRSLNFTKPNPNINFQDLKLTVCSEALLLPPAPHRCAGVNAFGFGGTNAHAVVAPGRKSPDPFVDPGDAGKKYFLLSAESKAALGTLAQTYAQRTAQLSHEDLSSLARAVAHRREHLSHRTVVSASDGNKISEALNAYAEGADHAHLTTGTAIGNDIPVAFVYSGNGSQWAGMGRVAYRNNVHFRSRFEQVDGHFKRLAGWSLQEAMFSEDLAERLPLTSVAQPLIFAIQSAATAALRASGLEPAAVLGHSVGEVAAAEAAGVFDLRTAVKVIHFRSKHQELTRNAGRMAAVLASAETVAPLARAAQGAEIVAVNSPRAVTVAGPTDALAKLKAAAEGQGITVIELDLDYPFHTALMAPVEKPLLADLKDIKANDADVPFVSSVTGAVVPGSRLDRTYWWRNVREPVKFAQAVTVASKLGARYFVEIGPSGVLLKHIGDSLEGERGGFASLSVLDRSSADVDPFDRALAKALVTGAQVNLPIVFGTDPGPGVTLPTYPWQQTEFRFTPSAEAIGTEPGPHPFLGGRLTAEALEWRSHVDTALHPELADHKLGEQTIFPGAGFFEMGLAAAQRWLKTNQVVIADCELIAPLDLTSGETRELLTRVSPGSATFEVFSRPRLSQAAWLMHCRAKALHANPIDESYALPIPATGHRLDDRTLYRLASGSGLNYGPAFRLVSHATVHSDKLISVELTPQQKPTEFLLDPMRLDACVHSMIALFPELRAEQRGVTFVPVRVDEAILFRPHGVPARALMEITIKSERSVRANFYIYDSQDRVVAILRGARCQALPVRRTPLIEDVALIELALPTDGAILGESGVSATPDALVHRARALGLVGEAAADHPSLLEGWALAAAYEIASSLADDGHIDIAALVALERLPEDLRPWLANILTQLEGAGLAAQDTAGTWRLVRDEALPSSASVIKTLSSERSSHAGELLVAGAITGLARRAALERKIGSTTALNAAALDFYDSANRAAVEASQTLWRLLRETKGLWSKTRALRVLVVGFAPLVDLLLASDDERIHLTVFEPNRRLYDSAAASLAGNASVTLLDGAHADALGTYDIIVSVGGLHRLPADFGLDRLGGLLAPRGMLAAIEPAPALFKDLAFGLDPAWFASGTPDYPVSALQTGEQWAASIAGAAFASPETCAVRCGSEAAILIAAGGPAAHAAGLDRNHGDEVRVALVGSDPEFAAALRGNGISVVQSPSDVTDYAVLSPHVVMLDAARSGRRDTVAALSERCMQIKTCAERMTATSAQLWLVFRGARGRWGAVQPVETGAWAFSRTLANEFPKIDVRRIDLAPDLDPKIAAQQIRKLILSGTTETEFVLHGPEVRVLRVQGGRRIPVDGNRRSAAAARLTRRSRSRRRVAWLPVERPRIGPDEVEIEVEATGLNFRDLMWTMGLLPDDMLEDGFSGPALGLECAGRVVKTGSKVKQLQRGDRVVALAGSAFSTHVAAHPSQVARIPDGMSFAAATTIPVAFLTAYYALVTLAKLKRREWVLIHGGAGGVGMAAIQIASARGARIIATAGSRAKRDLLRSLGVRHILNSRSLNIVGQVMRITGAGVDVVLNSVAGEAMERAITCLRPFGRFVELGKRDYVSNTHVGLRPFRRNLSYFGVDVDQLVGAQRSLGERVFRTMMKNFDSGKYRPLPHSVFRASDAQQAFALMQHSNHIGKIVVEPPKPDAVPAETRPFTVNPNGSHVITGAFGGFGLETAKWLVDRGARHLVMIGRRGAVTSEAQSVLADFAARGVNVMARSCDVGERRALDKLFQKMAAKLPPVCGVMHAAMVLDDAVIPNLDVERFNRVLEPKVRGADNLDALTRGSQLDYFVLFSSVTTLMGNPGQGNYVAANAYMEGLARRRRQQGLPALAIGWGPIIDVGVVAQNERLQANLKKLTGVSGMRARDALNLLEQALALDARSPDAAVMTISPNDGNFDSNRLAVLRSPTYAALTRHAQPAESEGALIDLKALLQSEGMDVARRKVGDIISSQLARVLHAREEDISRVRPLGEMGLDSLMALELVQNLEGTFGTQIALSSSAGALTVLDVVEAVLANVDANLDRKEATLSKFVEQHLEKAPVKDYEIVRNIVEGDRKSKRLLS